MHDWWMWGFTCLRHPLFLHLCTQDTSAHKKPDSSLKGKVPRAQKSGTVRDWCVCTNLSAEYCEECPRFLFIEYSTTVFISLSVATLGAFRFSKQSSIPDCLFVYFYLSVGLFHVSYDSCITTYWNFLWKTSVVFYVGVSVNFHSFPSMWGCIDCRNANAWES